MPICLLGKALLGTAALTPRLTGPAAEEHHLRCSPGWDAMDSQADTPKHNAEGSTHSKPEG